MSVTCSPSATVIASSKSTELFTRNMRFVADSTISATTSSLPFASMNARDMMINPTQNLMTALKSGSFARIRSAIKMPCVDYNHHDADHDSRTPLMRVCALADVKVSANARRDLAKLLLAKHVDVNAADRHSMTALAIACQAGDAGMVTLLANESDVDPNLSDSEGNTPLMHACRSGKPEVVSALLTTFKRVGLRVDETDNEGMTPLMEAARAGHTDTCRVLVQEGHADVNIRDTKSACTAMDYAIESGRCTTPELLILSPVAQRKVNARQHRESAGHSTLKDIIETTNLHRPKSEWLKPTKLSATSRKYESLPLPTEYAEQANSMVFQVGKRLQRLAEDAEGEQQEEAEMEEERRRAPIRRRYTLPSARHCVYGAGSGKNNRGPSFQVNMTASGSPRLASRGRGKPEWLKLPPVPETTSLSRSPSPTERQAEESHSQSPVSTTSKSRATSSPKAISPPISPSSRVRALSPTRSPPSKTGRFLPPNCHTQARLTMHEPSIATSSYKRPTLRISHTWEGRPSSTVPSYLFR